LLPTPKGGLALPSSVPCLFAIGVLSLLASSIMKTDALPRQRRAGMQSQSTVEIEYPETDGQPMGETDLHRNWMFRIIELLQHRYRGQQVYVTGDLLLYFEEGNPHRYVVPDAMVVKDCDPSLRRTYKLWEEKRLPSAVFETTSKYTKRKDSIDKPQLYEKLRIPEYFLYDPTADYLRPPLQGYRLTDNRYVRIEPDSSGRLLCSELSLWLRVEDGELVMYDCESGQRLLTEAEDIGAAYEAERAAHDAERAARETAEAEIERLRAKLKELGLAD
jgi:Uma2 family endonuclease